MGIQVSVEMFDLSEEGVFGAAGVALQGVELGERDWRLTGPVLERMGLSLTYRDRDPIGRIPEPWTATPRGEVLGESATCPHLAVAKAVVMTAMKDERLPVSIEQAIRWVQERCILVDVVEKPSRHHEVVDHGGNRFTASAKAGVENLEQFQNVVMLVEALEDEYLREETREAGADGLTRSVTYVLL